MNLLELHNKARQDNKWGRSWYRWRTPVIELRIDPKLMEYAMEHCVFMAQWKDKLVHSAMEDILDLGFNRAAENIAFGQRTEEEVMLAWMRSYGHRRNILNETYTKMGYACVPNKLGMNYWCVVFGA